MPENARITRSKTTILAAFVLILIALSSFGSLDKLAKNWVEETTEESIKIFALSKSINAGISVLQSSQIKIPFVASIQVGEALDPINDAVERLSTAMVWATGSLFLQQIVLEVAASSVFKWGIFVVGLVALFALLLVDRKRFCNRFCEVFNVSEAAIAHYRDMLVRIFVVASIFRFIVPAFVIIGFLFSQMFLLDTKIDKHKEELSSFNKQVSIDVSSPIQESEKADKESKKPDDETEQQGHILEIFGDISPKDWLEKLSNLGKAIYTSSHEILNKYRKAGSERIQAIIDKSSNMVTSITTLLIAIVIKNILLPLVFLAIAVKGSLPLARYSMRLVSGLRRDANDLQGYIERGD